MKHILSLIFFFLAFAFTTQAQTYAVYSMQGDIRLVQNKKSVPMQLHQNIQATANIIVPATGKLILLDKSNRKLFTINKPYSGIVSHLIADNTRCSMKNLSRQYLRYLVGQMSGKGVIEKRSTYMDRTASAYRDVEMDSTTTDSAIVVEEKH